MELFPPSAKDLWDEWGIRVMVMCSLLLQAILIFLGNRRKTVAVTRVRFILWFAYLSADWFATVALGALSNKMGDDDPGKRKHPNKANNQLLAFWAPFLLLHLGGPDTITAYALEDNELWLRHLLGLGIQSSVAFYIFILSWKGDWVSMLNIPMFIAGLIKYGERTWVLRSASRENFRDSMLDPPDPGPNYAKFMDEYSLKREEGFHINVTLVNEGPTADTSGLPVEREILEHDILVESSYNFFESFKRLFVDLILSFQDRDKSRSFFRKRLAKDAFKIVELELGFIYDVLFTKAILVFSVMGIVLRSVSFCATVSALVAFAVMEKDGHPLIDLMITYLLLCVAVILEIYAVVLLLSSDWTILWSISEKTKGTCPGFQFLRSMRPITKHRWSNAMAQYNLLSVCIKEKPMIFASIYKFLCIDEWIESYHYKSYEQVLDKLKDFIYEQLEEKSAKATDDLEVRRNLCHSRGKLALEKYSCLQTFSWSIEVEFDQSILLWHIATDLCYYSDFKPNDAPPETDDPEMGKLLSDYILYLLVMRPFMLPAGIGQIRFRDTCAEAKSFFHERRKFITNEALSDSERNEALASERSIDVSNDIPPIQVKGNIYVEAKNFFHERRSIPNKALACKRLIDVSTNIPPIQVKGDRSKSVLFDACRLAKSLQSMGKEERWGLINQVWVEILCYAANQCKGNYHAQQLGRGGELLTHVWLLMAHLGITEQFQISQGHMRAKLEVK